MWDHKFGVSVAVDSGRVIHQHAIQLESVPVGKEISFERIAIDKGNPINNVLEFVNKLRLRLLQHLAMFDVRPEP